MSDITKCEDSLCPSKEKCYRYTAPTDDQFQSYSGFNREADADNCIAFWDNAKCAYCNLENGNHKLSCPIIKITMIL
jgi:hypothetical protein